MHADTSWLTVLAAILLVRWLGFEAVTERAVRKGNLLLFRAPTGLRLLFGFSLPGMVYAAGAVVLSQDSRRDWWLSIIFIGFATLIAYIWPADIGLSKSAIYEQKWLGLWKKTVPWEDVDYATADPADNSVEVVSKSGVSIRHTKYHVDRRDFLAEIRNRCRFLEAGHGIG